MLLARCIADIGSRKEAAPVLAALYLRPALCQCRVRIFFFKHCQFHRRSLQNYVDWTSPFVFPHDHCQCEVRARWVAPQNSMHCKAVVGLPTHSCDHSSLRGPVDRRV